MGETPRCWLLKDELVSPNGSNSLYYTIRQLQLLFPYGTNYTDKQYKEFRELLSSLATILVSPAVTKVFSYFVLYEASTALLLESRIEIPPTTVYRALKKLEKMRIIEKRGRISMKRRSEGGPKPHVYVLLTATDECIRKCRHEHLRMASPKYRVAEKFIMGFITDYLAPRKIEKVESFMLRKAISELDQPYSFGDVYQLSVMCLKEQGYDVWR